MRRWIILGRGGTVLMTIGLVLLLVSLIPPAQFGGSAGSNSIYPKTFWPTSEHLLTPQQGLRVTITANGSLRVYLLEVDVLTLYDWIREHHPEQPMTFPDFFNVTRLEEFLEANPSLIGWQGEIREGKIEYIPTKVTSVTLAFSNPSSHYIAMAYEGSMITLVAPGTRVRTLAQLTIPIGFVLVLPWVFDFWRQKEKASRFTTLDEANLRN